MDAGRVVVRYQADASSLQAGTQSARQALASVGQAAQATGSLIQSAFAGGLAALGLQGVLGSVGGAFAAIKGATIGMNAELEKTTQQFKVFTGSADAAQEHVRSLYEFAKTTPFEARPVIEASRFLRLFGGAALDTGETLTLMGNAAAATSAPIQEVSFWFGRAYSAIQGGQPFGEARMRLQELAIISPEAAAALEKLDKSGGSAAEKIKILTDDLGRFDGAMTDMANLWEGVTSTISDAINIAGKDIMEPWFDLVKDGLKVIRDFLDSEVFAEFVAYATVASQSAADAFRLGLSTIGETVQELAAWLAPIGEMLGSLADRAREWGANIVLAIADGMAAGLDALVSVMNAITDLLTFWLAPGSPPRVAPDLDDWGRSAMQEWLDGWLAADFGVFTEIATTIEDAIRQIGAGASNRDLLEWIMGSRVELARAIDEWREVGEFGADALDRIEAAAGPAGETVRDLAAAYFELADAQREVETWTRELGRLNRELDATLRPVIAAQAALADAERDRAEAEQLGNAARNLAAGKMSQEEYNLLVKKIDLAREERAIRAAFRAPIDDAKAELDLAKEREEAAKGEWDARTAMLNIQKENSRLIGELTKAAGGGGAASALGNIANVQNRTAEAAERAAAAQEKLAAAQETMRGFFTLLTQADPESRIEGFTKLAAAIGEGPAEKIALATSALHGLIQVLSGDAEGGLRRMGEAMNGLYGRDDADERLANLGRSLMEFGEATVRAAQAIGRLVEITGDGIGAVVNAALAAQSAWQGLTGVLSSGAASASAAVSGPFGAIANLVGAVLPPVMSVFSALWDTAMGVAGAAAALFGQIAQPALDGVAEILRIVAPLTDAFGALFGAVLGLLGEQIGLWWSVVQLVFASFDFWLRGTLTPTVTLFGAVVGMMLDAAKANFEILWAVVGPILSAIATWFAETGKTVLETFTTDLARRVDQWTEFFNQARKAVGWLEDRILEFIAWLSNLSVPNPFAGIIGAIGAMGPIAGSPGSGAGGGGESGARAFGGPVEAGRSYLVGERGAERFIPASNGYIVPPSAGGRSANLSIGAVSVTPTLTVSDGRLVEGDLERMSEQIAATVLDAIALAGAGLSLEGA